MTKQRHDVERDTRGQDHHELRTTDYGNARRLVRVQGRDLRHVAGLGWLAWDGRCWRRDEDGEVMRRAAKTIVGLFQEAAESRDAELAAWAKKSLAEPRLRAAVSLAATERPVIGRVEEFDSDPWLLNCSNGTVDLRTGEVREHRRDDLCTKLTRIAYDPGATCPTWDSFLRTTFGGDMDMADFVQRAVGYSLTGLASEHVLLFLHGLGANGKSTFLTTLLRLAGEYGIQAEPDLLLVRHGDAHPTGLADLFGVRVAVCVEIDEGRRLAESLVKQITGGDVLRARRMRQDFFEFSPQHTVWIAANHKPTVRGTDNAIWRRIRLLPFNVTIPDHQQDRQLGDKLATELPGILAWAVRGATSYQQHGLSTPAAVQAATAAYRDEQDTLGNFFTERCTIENGAKTKAADLYAAYVAWTDTSHERPLSQALFGGRLRERGFEQHRGTGGVRSWLGIGLTNQAEANR